MTAVSAVVGPSTVALEAKPEIGAGSARAARIRLALLRAGTSGAPRRHEPAGQHVSPVDLHVLQAAGEAVLLRRCPAEVHRLQRHLAVHLGGRDAPPVGGTVGVQQRHLEAARRTNRQLHLVPAGVVKPDVLGGAQLHRRPSVLRHQPPAGVQTQRQPEPAPMPRRRRQHAA